ncbi:MAG TPA: hypothetical protein VFW65_03610 [Pseudonocardiaceae bacterium]|nr:hypothetical protein [Pseudonocardiaceae bacterium]
MARHPRASAQDRSSSPLTRSTTAAIEPQVLPATHRFVYLPELDLMAELAWLESASRHSDWFGGAFNPATGRHISVYTKPNAG